MKNIKADTHNWLVIVISLPKNNRGPYMPKQRLIKINDDTLVLFKTTSSQMEEGLTYNEILMRVLDHWNRCTEVEIDNY